MNYFVIGTDGNQYGPADIATLKDWAAQNRLFPTSQLRDAQTGQSLLASAMPGLFPGPAPMAQAPMPQAPQAPAYQQPAAYPRATNPVGESNTYFWGAVVRSGLALIFFFVLGGLGLIVGGYGLYYGIQCYQSGHSKGLVALIISVVSFLLILAGWALRLNHRLA